MHLEALKVRRHQQHLVVAVIADEAGAIAAVRRLHRIGIGSEAISLLALDTEKVHEAIAEIGPVAGQVVHAGGSVDAVAEETSVHGRDETKGTALGGCVGLVIGLGVFAIPGLGAALLAAGPVVMAINVLGHTIAGGVGMGLVLGAIFDERVTEDHRDHYKQRLEQGAWLLVLHGDDPLVERAAAELKGAHVERVETF
jgi:hypothetical protein